MTSVFLSPSGGLPAAALGGEIPMEVQTQYVADGFQSEHFRQGCPGKAVDSISGQMYSNLFRMPTRSRPMRPTPSISKPSS